MTSPETFEQSKTAVASSDGLAVWHKKLKAIAKRKGVDFLIVEAEAHCESFEDGLTPAEALDEEIDAARDCC